MADETSPERQIVVARARALVLCLTRKHASPEKLPCSGCIAEARRELYGEEGSDSQGSPYTPQSLPDRRPLETISPYELTLIPRRRPNISPHEIRRILERKPPQ